MGEGGESPVIYWFIDGVDGRRPAAGAFSGA